MATERSAPKLPRSPGGRPVSRAGLVVALAGALGCRRSPPPSPAARAPTATAPAPPVAEAPAREPARPGPAPPVDPGAGAPDAPSPSPEAPASEEALAIPLEVDGGHATLRGTLYRPAGRGPFPLVVMSHGTGRSPTAPVAPWHPAEQARWFNARGWIVAVPMRRGYGDSDGPRVESYGPCDDADFFAAGRRTADDIRATLEAVTERDDVDAGRVVLLGHSAGGFGSLALASLQPGRVVAVVNFAGGRGSQAADDGESRTNCSPDDLVAAARRYGATTTVPSLWLYAANDQFFAPPLAREMFDAFREGSPTARFVPLPPHGVDGHGLFLRPAAMPLWTAEVERFLAALPPR